MPRVKDAHKHHNSIVEGLSPDMKSFVSELETVFPNIRYTSGKRTKQVGHSDESHHHTGDALDFGKEHREVYDFLYNTKNGNQLLAKYNLGIIDETDPEMMKKTGATGAHFHIGKDTHFAQEIKKKLEQSGDNTTTETIPGKPTPFEIVDANGEKQLVYVDTKQLYKAKEKDEVEEKEVEEDPALQEIKAKQEERSNLATALLDKEGPVEYFNEKEDSDNQGIQISEIEIPETQGGLPTLPQMFSVGDIEEV